MRMGIHIFNSHPSSLCLILSLIYPLIINRIFRNEKSITTFAKQATVYL